MQDDEKRNSMKIINTIESPKKFNIEELLNFLAEKLNISEDVELTVAYNDRLLNMLSKDIEYSALLQKILPKKYILFISSDADGLQYILCHEMIHLSQYERGDLEISPDFKQVTWKGNKYSNSVEYKDREWEEEAFSLQNKLWKEFKKEK